MLPRLLRAPDAWHSQLAVLVRLAAALTVGLLLVAVGKSDPTEAVITITDIGPSSSTLDPADPDGASGGRTNGLANVSDDDQVFYAATEWGGLYKSVNGGVDWFRLNNHLPNAVWDVEVDPGNTGTVYATSMFDGRVNNPLSGVEVSYDGGATWTKPASANPPVGYNCNAARVDEPSALGIGIRPDAPANVFVGTNCGVARTTNSGATWTFVDPTPATPATNVWDVVVQAGGPNNLGIIDVCGDDGVLRSVDGGNTWTGGQGALADGQDNDGDTNVDEADEILPTGRCSIAASPDESYVLLVVFGTRIFESDNGGAAWSREFANPSPQGRVPFVATNQRANDGGGNNLFDFWFGDVRLHRAGCTTSNPPAQGGTPRCPASGAWAGPFTRTVGAHDDSGDISFDSDTAVDACPRLFSSDGGVYHNTDFGADCHNPNWEQPNTTPHSLMLWAMDGADEAGDPAEDLYFGTQDNGSFGTINAGAGSPSWTNSNCCDVFDFQGDGDRAIYSFCCGSPRATTLVIRNPDLTGGGAIANNSYPPDGLLTGFNFQDGLDQWGDKKYVMLTLNCVDQDQDGVDNDGDTNIDEADEDNGCPKANSDGGVFITDDITAGPIVWTELGNATEPDSTAMCGIQASTPASTPNTPTFYLQVGACNNAAGDTVWKYTGTATNGTWDRIDNNDGLTGGFSFMAADPNDPNRLYASNIILDVSNNPVDYNMVFSIDGGATWDTDADLNDLMDASGFFKAVTQRGPGPAHRSYDFGGYPQPAFVEYDQENGQIMVAGGHDSGVFLSTDGGQNWGLVTDPFNSGASGIPHIPRPFYGYFDHEPAGEVNIYIGTGGRGVWRLTPPVADVSVSKFDSPDPVNAGEQLYYTIIVSNSGPDTAENVVIHDTLPAQVSYVTDDLSACGEAPTDVLTCPIGDIASGDSVTLVIKVAVDANAVVVAGGPFGMTNNVTVSTAGSIDTDLSNNSASEGTIVEDSADLQVTKECKPDQPLHAGDTGTCTILVDNLGPSDARDVVLTDTHLSDGAFTIVSAVADPGGTCAIAGGIITCNLGTEPAGGRTTVTVTVTANAGADINDCATVTSATPDPDTSNNQDCDGLTVVPEADLSVTKTGAPEPVLENGTLTYTIGIRNEGPSTAVNVVVSDVLPAEVNVISVSATGASSCNAGTPGDPFDPTVCTFDSLPMAVAAGPQRTMTIVTKVKPNVVVDQVTDQLIIHNDVRISSDTFDPNNANDLATWATTVQAQADLVVVKTTSGTPIAGTDILYQYDISNNGPSVSRDVTFRDNLPLGTTFVDAFVDVEGGTGGVPLACTISQPINQALCPLGDIPLTDGAPVIIRITVHIAANVPTGTSLTNSADVFLTDTPDPNAANSQDDVTVIVQTRADIEIIKTSTGDLNKPSQEIAYRLVVRNHGPSDAQNVVVTDLLPLKKQDRVFWTPGIPTCTKPNGGFLLTCNLGTIPANSSKQVTVYVIYKGSRGIVSNTGEVTTTTFDPNPANNSSTNLVLVGQPPKP